MSESVEYVIPDEVLVSSAALQKALAEVRGLGTQTINRWPWVDLYGALRNALAAANSPDTGDAA